VLHQSRQLERLADALGVNAVLLIVHGPKGEAAVVQFNLWRVHEAADSISGGDGYCGGVRFQQSG
jgi:hypothetical protein